jgi:hypothetical protein
MNVTKKMTGAEWVERVLAESRIGLALTEPGSERVLNEPGIGLVLTELSSGRFGPGQIARIALGGGDGKRARGRLTQWEIDARDAGWEYRSNSTNALMARVLAEVEEATSVK